MELKQLILNRPPWLSSRTSNEKVILSSRVSISRNLDAIPFPAKSSLMEKERIFNQVSKIIDDRELLGENRLLIDLQEVGDVAKTLLFERDFINFDIIHGSGKRGVIVGEENIGIVINGENHLEITRVGNETNLEPIWKKLDKIDTILGKELTYAYDEKQGFLLSDIKDSGTGLTVEFTLHLLGLQLTNTLEQSLNGVAQMGVSIEGKFREGAESWGALFTLKAGVHTGSSEKEILKRCFDITEELVKQELLARDKLFSEAKMEMEDKIWRSLGVLQYARLVSIPQLLNLTSALRLGIERDVISDILTIDNLNSIISASLQGSVAILMEDITDDLDSIDERRAEIIRTLLDV